MVVYKIEKLCGGDVFWDYNLTWNTTNPDFTDCFQSTVLSWVPCAVLWLLAPIEVYQFYQCTRSKRGCIPWTILNVARIFFCAALVCLSIIQFGVSVIIYSSDVYVPPVDFITPAIKLCTFMLVLSFTILEKKKGMQTSGVQWFYWLISVIAGLPIYRSFLMRAFNESMTIDELEFVTEAVAYPLTVVQFVLCCVSDANPINDDLNADDDPREPCPELSASFPSLMFFSWFDSMALQGFRTDLERKDLWALNPQDRSGVIFPLFDKYWQKDLENRERKSLVYKDTYYEERPQFLQESLPKASSKAKAKLKEPNIIKVLFQSFGWLYVFGTILKFISDLFLFVNPLILDLLISFVSSDEPQWKGFLYAVIMMAVAIINLVMIGRSSHIAYLVGMRIRSALISAIYRKALRLSSSAKRDYTLGEIVNLMAVDVQRMVDVTVFFNLAWTTPVQFSIALYLIWQRLGPAVLSGIGVIILLSITTIGTAGYAKKLQTNQMKLKDRRIKLMNEILNGIKVLKLYAWEMCFSDIVSDIRSQEIVVLRKAAYFGTGMTFVWMSSSVLISLMTFATYVLMDSKNVLDANKAFVSLSLFGVMQTPIMIMPMAIVSMIQATVAMKRIKKFMVSEEIDLDNVQHVYDEKYPIKVEKASFSWSLQDPPTLNDINLRVKQNSLVAVVGPVGSGKSSLVSAILGEMEKLQGRVSVSDSIAYVSQLSWMQNATIRDNILFGKPYKASFYNKVVEACALKPDLQILPAGDQTEIGEKGINLSGGQKQRISLARAVYSNANIFIFDDPLSAVDVHVGTHIFDNVVGPKGMLQGKTRVLVTHRITYLPQVDNIVVISNGSISEIGTYKELLERKGVFAEFLVTYLTSPDNDEEEPEGVGMIKEEILTKIGSAERDMVLSRSISRSDPSDGTIGARPDFGTSNSIAPQLSRSQSAKDDQAEPPSGALIVTESTETGKVKIDTYLHYARSISFRVVCFTILFYTVAYGCSMGSSIWLSMWSEDKPNPDGTQDASSRDLRLGVYGGLGITFATLTFFSGLIITYGTTKAAEKLHSKMLHNIVRSPMSFFDTTPLGRIVNRFSKDVDVLDLTIPQILQMWMGTLFQILATIVVISIGTPIFLAAAVPNFVLYYFLQRFYVATSRQLKRLESITRSPIYSHFSETVAGAATIRAFGRQEDFINQSETKVDENQMCYYPSIISNRWISIRLELIGNVLVFFAALFAVMGRDNLNSGLVGLTVSYALSITAMLNWVVRLTSDLETNIVAVERIKEYTLTPTEADLVVQDTKPSPSWPTLGEITFDRYCTRYREGLDLVLRKVSCSIRSGEKVGIVGRTGAGKSSLTQALFRIVEAAGGAIKIDGIGIAKLGLHDLRSRLTIIPQDPVLFSGTLRLNLDPFNSHSDEEIWKALELSHLKTFVALLPEGLVHDIAEGGENLSVGQRQLICLSRALLRHTKILVLDEATAAVDLETDDLIQATIRKEFADCTVLTIAHRLNTIMDNDRIMVLDQGVIVEFDSPEELLQDRTSIFYGMAKDAGLA